MFPVESAAMTVFLGLMLPITNRRGLTFGGDAKLTFSKRHIIVLAIMFVVGVACVFGYLYYRTLK